MRETYLSERVASLKPSGIRKFFDIAATMKDVISLGIGEPDFTTPEPILEAGIQSLQNGRDPLHLQRRHHGAAPGLIRCTSKSCTTSATTRLRDRHYGGRLGGAVPGHDRPARSGR